jgi:nucleoside-diphosphate-sugar epimerase
MSTILVTGGGGFLGGAICRRLVEQGKRVIALQRSPAPALEALGVRVVAADLADGAAVARAAEGCDTVFHVAAKAGHWGSYEDYYRANVAGTENVLRACRSNGIARLVYTSTPSVVHAGRDLEGVDESTPYAAHYLAHYPHTKMQAERLVLVENGPDLATVALRPHLIWGPGDQHLLPRIVARAKAGRLKFIGKPGKRIDTTYIDNAVDAHLLAARTLFPGSPHSGRAYFISNGEPMAIEAVINGLLDCAGLPPVSARVPFPLAYAAGWLLEQAYGRLKLRGEPIMTRFVAEHLASAHWYNIGAAERDFGYAPMISMAEGLARLKAALKA